MDVTVFDRDDVAAGASRGNAGWLTPALATPLPEPGVLAYGLRAVLSPSSPVYIPPTIDPRLISFLARFVRNSTAARWRTAMSSLVQINKEALAAYDLLHEGGLPAETHEAASFTAAYRTEQERAAHLAELEHIRASGQPLEYDVLSGGQAREVEPVLSDEISAAIRLRGQRYIDPGAFTRALGRAVRDRRGVVIPATTVVSITETGGGVLLTDAAGATHRFDAVVVATGTWLGQLLRSFGVRSHVQAGRGYSFSVPLSSRPTGPIYFPTQRVACTPIGERLRLAGMMEFRDPQAPLDRRRIRAIVEAARPLLVGADVDVRQDEWVGSRPCTADGLPLIGPTRSARVFAAGGHGMWGVTLGPATGQLLTEQIVTGRQPSALRPFDPTR